MTVLTMALEQARRDGLINRNVATLAERPKVERVEVKILDPAEARRFVAVCNADPLEALWLLLIGTGVRLGEALTIGHPTSTHG